MNELGVEYNLWLDELDVLNKEARMDLIDQGYHEQEDLKCCKNCAQHDSAHNTEGTEYALCTVYGDPVADTAICDLFEF